MDKFKYDRSKTMEENWEQYAAEHELVVTTKAKEEAYNKKRLAFHKKFVTSGFREHFGRNENAIEGWRGICETLGISGAESFSTISRCKKALEGTFVNIVDLVDARNAEHTLLAEGVFTTRRDLARYIRETKKIYPLGAAKDNPLLQHFLIKIGGHRGHRA